MSTQAQLPKHWDFWTQQHPGLLGALNQNLEKNSEAYKDAFQSLLVIFSKAPLLYSKLLSEDSSQDMSPPRLKDYLDWLIQSHDLLDGYWETRGPRPGFFLFLSRSIDRFLEARKNESKSVDLSSSQINPIALMAAEILGRVERYADKLDQSTHLCFVLHAEGLLNQEISAITKINNQLVQSYIENAKHLIKERLSKGQLSS